MVLCNPLGYEAMCAHRTYRQLAERLAARGFPALRFDYQGTGDSSGYPDEPERVPQWIASIDAALDELRERSGVGALGLFGTRFGATLAAVVAARRGDVDSLVLWAPSPSGRAYTRELRAFRMIKQPGGVAPNPPDGAEEAAGYSFSKATLSDLSAIDLVASKQRPARRVLIVPRDDLPGGEARLVKSFTEAGADVTLLPEPGYEGMMRDPQATIVPVAALDKMVGWLGEAEYPDAPVASAPPSVQALMTVQARTRDAQVRERPIRFGEGDALFGLLTEPVDRPAASNRPAVVLLNVGANHRVGPNRMYVALARDLAARGYEVLRFDVAGLGDSVTDGTKENRLYSKDSVGDVRVAMSHLQALCGAQRFVLVGLCSGAYLAFHTCIEDERAVGQILLNPQTFEWKEGDSLELSMRKSFLSTRYYMRALFNPTVWNRGLRGQLNVRGVAGALRERFTNRVRALAQGAAARARGQTTQSDIERAFRAVTKRGVESLLVFSFDDGGLDMIERHLGRNARGMRAEKRFVFEIVEGADHTFTPVGSQVVLHELLVKYVVARFP